MKRLISLLLCAMLLAVSAAGALAETFTGAANGIGEVTVTLTVEDGRITAAEVAGDGETPGYGGIEACKDGTYAAQIVAAQGADIDGVSGATVTSDAVRKATTLAMRPRASSRRRTSPSLTRHATSSSSARAARA